MKILVYNILLIFLSIGAGLTWAGAVENESVSLSLEVSHDTITWGPLLCRPQSCDISGWRYVRAKTHMGQYENKVDCLAKMEAAMRAIEPFYLDRYGPSVYTGGDEAYSSCDKDCLKKKIALIEKREAWVDAKLKAEKQWNAAKQCWRTP